MSDLTNLTDKALAEQKAWKKKNRRRA